ncbi:MAG: PAS domain S-box protein [Anaerolineaceae bacterium]|nr:PAS domain S-box protein [Anaerolineaceae bacterium]
MSAISDIDQPYLEIIKTASDGVVITDLKTSRVLVTNPAAAEMHGYTPDDFCGKQIREFIHAKSRPYFADYPQVIQRGDLFEMLAQHIREDQSIFDVEWRAVAFKYLGRTCALALLRDVSKRITAEHQLQRRVGLRVHEQSTLLEISQTLASTLELQPQLILDQLGMLIKYTHAVLFTLEDTTLVALAVRGSDRLESSAPFRVHLNGKNTLETLFNGRQPIRIADLWGTEISAIFLRKLLKNDCTTLLEGVLSWMWVPLAVKNRIIGGFGIAHKNRNYFTRHHADLAMTIANQAAVTLVNAELYEHAQALAASQERQRLAQNLHDAVNQSLFSAGLIAEVLPRLWEREPEAARRSLEDLRHLTRGAMAEMRALLAELRPTTLTDTELGELLRLLANAFTGRTNIPADVVVDGEGDLPADTQVALYRICQEALNNTAKHARAGKVEINLQHTPKGVALLIHDNGCGFMQTKMAPSGHYGLGMMQERAKTIGAKLMITSQPGKGTDVIIHWEKQEVL